MLMKYEVLCYPENYFMPCFIGIGKSKADQAERNIGAGADAL